MSAVLEMIGDGYVNKKYEVFPTTDAIRSVIASATFYYLHEKRVICLIPRPEIKSILDVEYGYRYLFYRIDKMYYESFGAGPVSYFEDMKKVQLSLF